MGTMPERPSSAAVRETLDEIVARRRRADDERREQLGDQLWEVLDFLRRYPAGRSEDAAADGQAALVLLAELRWQLVEHEHTQLVRLDGLPTHTRPSNAQVGGLLGHGLHRQSVRDRRDRDAALLQLGRGNEHDTRAARAATRDAATHPADETWLASHADELHELRGQLLALADQTAISDADAHDWLTELDRDHREQATGRQALAVLGLTASTLRISCEPLPPQLATMLEEVERLRAAYRTASG